MKETPILFGTPMVQAILEGRKTMTRRIVKPMRTQIKWLSVSGINKSPAIIQESNEWWSIKDIVNEGNITSIKCPYGQPCDRLWVRETFQPVNHPELKFRYKADHLNPKSVIWKPSIFMPKAAARIWLEVVQVKVERLQDISREDAEKEGVECKMITSEIFQTYLGYKNYLFAQYDDAYYFRNPVDSFESLWSSINGEGTWEENPWVWVIEFKRL